MSLDNGYDNKHAARNRHLPKVPGQAHFSLRVAQKVVADKELVALEQLLSSRAYAEEQAMILFAMSIAMNHEDRACLPLRRFRYNMELGSRHDQDPAEIRKTLAYHALVEHGDIAAEWQDGKRVVGITMGTLRALNRLYDTGDHPMRPTLPKWQRDVVIPQPGAPQ